jgi:hypothetical protein
VLLGSFCDFRATDLHGLKDGFVNSVGGVEDGFVDGFTGIEDRLAGKAGETGRGATNV